MYVHFDYIPFHFSLQVSFKQAFLHASQEFKRGTAATDKATISTKLEHGQFQDYVEWLPSVRNLKAS